MRKTLQQGFSLAEVLVVIGIFAVLSSLATINLLSAQHSASLQGQLATIIADIKQQQIKAMQGDTEGRASPDYYGVHFTTNAYTIFHGTSYNPNDSANLTFPLDTVFQFTNITFTNSNLIFIPLSGEMYGYSSVTNSVILKDTTNNKQRQLQFNYLGVLTGLN
jgi:prepilin-type N-terminal cleavage/methylation domain-containing protein